LFPKHVPEYSLIFSIATVVASSDVVQWLGGGLDKWGFESLLRQGIFFFFRMSRWAVAHIQPFIQWVLGFFFMRVELLGCEGELLPPGSTVINVMCLERSSSLFCYL
jgi:hypothetical protein